MFPSSIVLLGCSRSPTTRQLLLLRNTSPLNHLTTRTTTTVTYFTAKRMLTQRTTTLLKSNTRPHYTKLTPLLYGGIRQHGSHGHHHHDADLMNSLKSSSKRGIRITIIGLASNVGLTVTKGVAGWVMNSASLLAEALHSFSDLLSDFVTLYTFKMSRKPPDAIYPYGYGKFETIGSVTVSSLLLAGAVGIGYHSFDLLMQTLQTSSSLIVTDTTATAAAVVSSQASESHSFFSHSHSHGTGVLDPNAAWFALASVIIKEWLYRATIKVGRAERSEVLMANAWHHRSDAYSSAVALVAIVGSYAGMPVLDPIGGIVVSGMLVKSSVGILGNSIQELVDRGITSEELNKITSAISQVKEQELDILNFHSVRGRKQGPFNHVDLVLQLSPSISMEKAHQLEQLVKSSVKDKCKNVQDILIYLEDSNAAAAARKAEEQRSHEHHEHEHEHEHEHDHDHSHKH